MRCLLKLENLLKNSFYWYTLFSGRSQDATGEILYGINVNEFIWILY